MRDNGKRPKTKPPILDEDGKFLVVLIILLLGAILRTLFPEH